MLLQVFYAMKQQHAAYAQSYFLMFCKFYMFILHFLIFRRSRLFQAIKQRSRIMNKSRAEKRKVIYNYYLKKCKLFILLRP